MITAGVVSKVSVSDTEVVLSATAVSGAVGPVEYQWYRSVVSGFTPGVGNIISGATSLDLDDTGLTPSTQYYYKLVAIDTGDSNAEADYSQFAIATSQMLQSQNAFNQSPQLGMLDLRFDPDTVSVEVDSSESGSLLPGQAVKIVDSKNGIPKVIACDSNDDEVFGFILFDIKSQNFKAGDRAEISQDLNVMYLFSTGAIGRGKQVTLDIVTVGGVAEANSGDRLVGMAYDKADAAGELIRVKVKVDNSAVAS